MRKFLIAAFAAAGLMLGSLSVSAEDKKKSEDEGVSGILIDGKCGKDKDEEKAAEHPAKCALACADKEGLGVVHGKKWIKFDEDGQKVAKKYLEDHKDDKDATKVHVDGKVSEDGKTMTVEAIHAQSDKEEKKKS